jgi:hypothetical protein
VVRVNPADGTRKVAVEVDDLHQTLAQDGLLGLALHPKLLDGRDYVYVMYTYDADPEPGEERRAKIRRYTSARPSPTSRRRTAIGISRSPRTACGSTPSPTPTAALPRLPAR